MDELHWWYSLVGIASRYGLDVLGIESWCGARIFANFQTGLGANSTSNKIGYRIIPEGIAAEMWS